MRTTAARGGPALMGARRRSAWLVLCGVAAGTAMALLALLALALPRPPEQSPSPAADLGAGTVVVEPVTVDLGHVPLDVNALAEVRLVNHSRERVVLGRASVETLEGC